MKDVSQQTLQDLITFIYRGEVKVNQDDFDGFLTIAKALAIKGLADANYDNFPAPKPTLSKRVQYQSSRTVPMTFSANSDLAPSNYYQQDNFDNENTSYGIKMENELNNDYDDDFQKDDIGEDNSTMDPKFIVPSDQCHANHHDSDADERQTDLIAPEPKRAKRAAPRKYLV